VLLLLTPLVVSPVLVLLLLGLLHWRVHLQGRTGVRVCSTDACAYDCDTGPTLDLSFTTPSLTKKPTLLLLLLLLNQPLLLSPDLSSSCCSQCT
jgi:hypothetical protein